ncbi:uncharacterized protein LOC117918845 [Vitis riparia]|uniref:uncharacterized protein LOC117918845 n=1 Tax=Vitis riparia TaxID=96939 RepID=UPI00155AE594|nr:uncharacterized protein LOC117918845 [Vitis riparia]
MEQLLCFIFFHIFIIVLAPQLALAADPACRDTCGSLSVKFPFGTGVGCGSPRFQPYISCSQSSDGGDQLLLRTHTGVYPITSISYEAAAFTVTPPLMSNCTSMQPSPNLGLDWASPFQLGPSAFILLSCPPSLTSKASPPICDPSLSHLCASIYTCPSVVSLGLPLFPPTNSCCVYSPANFNTKGELDLHALKCAAYASVVTLGDYPTDPTRWEYGVVFKYTQGKFDNYGMDTKCYACDSSGGVCGYAPPSNSFVCVCGNGFNTSSNCNGYSFAGIWSSGSRPTRKAWWGVLAWLGVLASLTIGIPT